MENDKSSGNPVNVLDLAEKVGALDERTRLLERKLDDIISEIRELRREMNQRFDAIDRRFDAVDRKIDGRYDSLNARIDSWIRWTVGLSLGGYALSIAILLAILRLAGVV